MPAPSEYEPSEAGRSAAVVRLIGLTWFVLACLIVGVMFIASPTNVANVVVALLILGGPGLLLLKRADDLREHNRLRWGWIVLLILPISVVLFAGGSGVSCCSGRSVHRTDANQAANLVAVA